MTMLAALDLEPISLSPRSIHRIENARGTQVTCVSGVVWITQEHDQRDVVLTPGQSFVLDRPGLGIVFALKGAVITVGAAAGLPAAARVYHKVRAPADRAWA
jgi:hypothetical protein